MKDSDSAAFALQDAAARLWPDSPAMRDRWISAVRYLRDGRGWIADRVVGAALKAQTEALAARPVEPVRFAAKITPLRKGKR